MMAGLVPPHEEGSIKPPTPRKRRTVATPDPPADSIKASKNGVRSEKNDREASSDASTAAETPAKSASSPEPKTDAATKRRRGRPPLQIQRTRRGLYLSDDAIYGVQELAQLTKRHGLKTNASEVIEALITFHGPKNIEELTALVQRYRDEFGVTEDVDG